MYTVQRNPHPVSDEERTQILRDPGFGDYFTDHMVLANWTPEDSWTGLRIVATAPLQMHPSAGVLHYGQEIFEGMKAYRHRDGSVWLFRPERNAARFANSARRMSMAPLPEDAFVVAVTELVDLDRAWVPDAAGEQSLYIRPFEFASETFLGVRSSANYIFSVIATPVGPYYPDPVKLLITPNYTRAAPGGTGAAKCGGNYAASLAAATEAHEHGCGQVLWLDGKEQKWVEECGTMNIAFITADREFLTPATTGTILEGVTRDSLLQLAPLHDLRPVERRIGIDEVIDGVRSGAITEVLACGTAAVVTPITGFAMPDADGGPDVAITVGDGAVGPETSALRTHLLNIQYGLADDPFGWMRRVG